MVIVNKHFSFKADIRSYESFKLCITQVYTSLKLDYQNHNNFGLKYSKTHLIINLWKHEHHKMWKRYLIQILYRM